MNGLDIELSYLDSDWSKITGSIYIVRYGGVAKYRMRLVLVRFVRNIFAWFSFRDHVLSRTSAVCVYKLAFGLAEVQRISSISLLSTYFLLLSNIEHTMASNGSNQPQAKRVRRSSENGTSDECFSCIVDYKLPLNLEPDRQLMFYKPTDATQLYPAMYNAFKCTLCHKIPKQIFSVVADKDANYRFCSHSYCGLCVDDLKVPASDYFHNQYKCAVCDLYGFDVISQKHPRIDYLRGLVKFGCPIDDCNFVGTMGEVAAHEMNCSKKHFKCPHAECTYVGTRARLLFHATSCKHRVIDCKHHKLHSDNIDLKRKTPTRRPPTASTNAPRVYRRAANRTIPLSTSDARKTTRDYPRREYEPHLVAFDADQLVSIPEHLKERDNYFTCAACMGIPRTPVYLTTCVHVVCSGCAAQIVETAREMKRRDPELDTDTNYCPTCRGGRYTEIDTLDVECWPSILRWEWLQLRFKCSVAGCTMEGDAEEMCNHEDYHHRLSIVENVEGGSDDDDDGDGAHNVSVDTSFIVSPFVTQPDDEDTRQGVDDDDDTPPAPGFANDGEIVVAVDEIVFAINARNAAAVEEASSPLTQAPATPADPNATPRLSQPRTRSHRNLFSNTIQWFGDRYDV